MITVMIESLIDFIQCDNGSYMPIPGGSPFNTAIALSRLDINVSFVGNISDDFLGDILVNHLAKNNVNINFINRVGNSTSLAFVKNENNQPKYAFYVNNTADISFDANSLKKANIIIKKATCLVFGSYSLSIEPSASTAEKIILAEKNNRIIALDPNIRFIPTIDKEKYLNRIKNLISACDILKLSIEDFINIYDKKLSIQETLEFLLKQGRPELIILTLGENGAYAITQNIDSCFVKAQRICVVDTVGAGDTFHAAILAGLEKYNYLDKNNLENIKPEDLREIMKFASTAAAINCLKKGANPPNLKEIKNFQI